MSTVNHVLVPFDFSDTARAALAHAYGLARAVAARVTLLHVIERGAPAAIHGAPHLTDAAGAEGYLVEAVRRLPPGTPVTRHVHAVREHDLPKSIADHAAELGCDLIVLCTHGRGRLRHRLFGSVAQRVAAQRNRPLPAFRMTIENEIPLARGMGSSATAIVAGITSYELLAEERLSEPDIFRYAYEFESHPDNLAAALYGGLVAAAMTAEGEVLTAKLSVADGIQPVVVIPAFELSTEKARAVLAQKQEANRRKQALVGRNVVSQEVAEEAQREADRDQPVVRPVGLEGPFEPGDAQDPERRDRRIDVEPRGERDAEREPEHDDEGLQDHREVHELADGEGEGKGDHDRQDREENRQGGRDQCPEDDDQHHHRHRQPDCLRLADTLLCGVGEVGMHGLGSGGVGSEPRGRGRGLRRLQDVRGGLHAAHVRCGRQIHHRVGGPAVGAHADRGGSGLARHAGARGDLPGRRPRSRLPRRAAGVRAGGAAHPGR